MHGLPQHDLVTALAMLRQKEGRVRVPTRVPSRLAAERFALPFEDDRSHDDWDPNESALVRK